MISKKRLGKNLNLKRSFFLLFLVIITTLISVNELNILNYYEDTEEGLSNDVLNKYNKYDFSEILLNKNNRESYGIIGENHQRIQIKFLQIKKNDSNPNEYFVIGKSKCKNSICDFTGRILLKTIRESKQVRFPEYLEYGDENVVARGFVVADYEFNENSNQKYSGTFKGELYTYWFIDHEDKMKYNDFNSISDSYTNNVFVGSWISNSTKKEKICNWGDYRVPNAKEDFDVGAGCFVPNEKYYDKGWENPYDNTKWWK